MVESIACVWCAMAHPKSIGLSVLASQELRYRHMTVCNSTCECRVMSADFYR